MSYGVVSSDMSLSGYRELLIENGFSKVYDNHDNVDSGKISDRNRSVWVDMDRGHLIELVGLLYDSGVFSVNLHSEIETLKCLSKVGDADKWLKSHLDYDEYRLLLGSEDFTRICHVRKDVKSGLHDYLSKINNSDFSVGYVDFLKINNVWQHFDKHPLHGVLKDNVIDLDVKKMFGMSD